MSDKPEALRLADALEQGKFLLSVERDATAAELRRLCAVEAERDALRAELREATEATDDPAVNNLRTLPESIRMLRAERDELLQALRALEVLFSPVAKDSTQAFWIDQARAAIAKAKDQP